MIPGEIFKKELYSLLSKAIDILDQNKLIVCIIVGIVLGIITLIKTAPKWIAKFFHK